MKKAAVSTTLLPCENAVILNEIFPASTFFQGGDRLSWIQKILFS
jgi:hypothetical protein